MHTLKRTTRIHYSLTYYHDNAPKTSSRDICDCLPPTPLHLATIIKLPFGLLSIINHFLLVINVAVPAQDLPLELLCVLVPELCSLPI